MGLLMDVMIQEEINNREVLKSGILLSEQVDVDFDFQIQLDDFSFHFRLSFITTNDGKFYIKPIIETNFITFQCNNFNNNAGSGLNKAIEIATFKGRKVYVIFWTSIDYGTKVSIR